MIISMNEIFKEQNLSIICIKVQFTLIDKPTFITVTYLLQYNTMQYNIIKLVRHRYSTFIKSQSSVQNLESEVPL